MKILVSERTIFAQEGDYELVDGWYRFRNTACEESVCREVEVELPEDFRPWRYEYDGAALVETDAFKREKLARCHAARAAEYPPMADYLDGVVKNDAAQIQAYIDACLAVKAKYPKPEAPQA
jgi:hypothetical protein